MSFNEISSLTFPQSLLSVAAAAAVVALAAMDKTQAAELPRFKFKDLGGSGEGEKPFE